MSKPQATIASTLQYGIKQLSGSAARSAARSDSPGLDSEILLLKVLNDSRINSSVPKQNHTKSWLLTWPEKTLSPEQLQQFEYYLGLRAQGMPIAYITGEKDFWTFTLKVSPATLIPRPETELLVEAALDKISLTEQSKILDMGTGSGAIALAIASERCNSQVLATDISQEALSVAQENSRKLTLTNIRFCLSHWFENIPKQQFDVIVSNPPYIALHDTELEDNVRKYEPLSALHSGDEGLDDINLIIQQSRNYLTPGGWLLFEHGHTQAAAVQALLNNYAFLQISTINDLNHLPRVTMARFT